MLFFLLVAWSVEVVDLLLMGGSLDAWGIAPRNVVGMRGIVASPFLHGGIPHLISNTIPFLVLGSLVALRGKGAFTDVTLAVALIGGLAVWGFGRPGAVHIGASGLIFGYFGFLVTIGLVERRFGSLLVSIAVGVAYGGMIFGVLPRHPGVSWEAHLFGFLSGILVAQVMGASEG